MTTRPRQAQLQQSVTHYRALHALMQQLDEALGRDDAELLSELQEQLLAVQEQARQSDALAAPGLAAEGEVAPLLAERQALLEALQEQNRLLSGKIRGILPVIADELVQLRAGQTAVSGYASGGQTRGGSVRGAY